MIPIVAYILGFGAYEGFQNNQKESSTRRGVLLNADRSSSLSFIYSPRSYDITKENLHPLKRGGGLSRILRAASRLRSPRFNAQKGDVRWIFSRN